ERVEGGYADPEKIAAPWGLGPVAHDGCQGAKGEIITVAERDAAAELQLPLSPAEQIAHRHRHSGVSIRRSPLEPEIRAVPGSKSDPEPEALGEHALIVEGIEASVAQELEEHRVAGDRRSLRLSETRAPTRQEDNHGE